MTLDEFQDSAARTINPRLTERDVLLDAAAGLAEESGEILGLVRKQAFQSRPWSRDELRAELGDALWCLAIAARGAGFSLEEVAAGNVEKLRARHPNGFADRAAQERGT